MNFNHYYLYTYYLTIMKKEYQEGKLPYARPSIELSDFMVESGIATSFTTDQNAIDLTVIGTWEEL